MAEYDNSNSGAIFKNEKRRSQNSPDYTGQAEIACPACGAVTETWLSAWIKKIKNGKNAGQSFMSLAFTPKDAPSQAGSAPNQHINSGPNAGSSDPNKGGFDDFDDDIPF